MLLPALSKARDKARIAGCLNNLKQLSMAGSLYTEENDGWTHRCRQIEGTTSVYWMKIIQPYGVTLRNSHYSWNDGMSCPAQAAIGTYSSYNPNIRLHGCSKNANNTGNSYSAKRTTTALQPSLVHDYHDLGTYLAFASPYMYNSNSDWIKATNGYQVGTRHFMKYNVVYLDGHAGTGNTYLHKGTDGNYLYNGLTSIYSKIPAY